ncbi:putative baseplate wedge subunit [Vibrio phage vB_VmeM-32]|nr:putative baseplate wedge subunit [Vibrio phage vB_VmeM-32]
MSLLKRRINNIRTSKNGGVLYSDIPRNMARDFTSNDLSVIKNVDAIQQSMINIITTRKGERAFEPTYGCEIDSSLFELMNHTSALVVERSIQEAINKHEPRVNITRVQVEPAYDINLFFVSIFYSIVDEPSDINKLSFDLTE